MSNFVYTDKFEADSTVIDSVFYNADAKVMVVNLHNGTLAGYEGVPSNVWDAFKLVHTSGESVGAFWNRFFRNSTVYSGFDTYNIDRFVSAGPVTEDNSSATEVEVETSSDLSDFYLTLNDGTEFTVKALSLRDALDRAEQIAVLAGWDSNAIIGVSFV